MTAGCSRVSHARLTTTTTTTTTITGGITMSYLRGRRRFRPLPHRSTASATTQTTQTTQTRRRRRRRRRLDRFSATASPRSSTWARSFGTTSRVSRDSTSTPTRQPHRPRLPRTRHPRACLPFRRAEPRLRGGFPRRLRENRRDGRLHKNRLERRFLPRPERPFDSSWSWRTGRRARVSRGTPARASA